MHELGIQSTMYRKRPKKPTTNTDTSQKPNLMRHLADLSGVVTTDITYIHLINQNWVYLATLFVGLWCKNNKRSDLTLFDNHLRASLLIIRLMIVTLKNQRG